MKLPSNYNILTNESRKKTFYFCQPVGHITSVYRLCINYVMSQNNDINKEPVEQFDDFYLFKCPYCKSSIVVMKNELNCKIFRCGVLKKNNEPINPHAPKVECDRLKELDLIDGCGRPFIFRGDYVEKCDYI